MEVQKRSPAVPRKFSEVKPEDRRISSYCSIVSVDSANQSILVDDGSSQVEVIFEDPALVEKAKDLRFVRIFGRPVLNEGKLTINGEIIQDMSKLNIDLKNKVEECLKLN